ncbi:MAG: methyltransferase domain-containing protein [Pontixanthobacter sp.]
MTFRSPVTGRVLTRDTPQSLRDEAGERWPVVDGITYLRAGRESLVARTLDLLDRGETDEALVVLLADQDDWWNGPQTVPSELRELIRNRDRLTLREAMALLRFGPVADYFAHRWSDPTYLAGLALLEAHWKSPKTSFELAAGIGHYARELDGKGVHCTCADVVFAKCWLAKHWVAPDADYLVFDAGKPWPIAGSTFDLVHCQDAFYFLPDQTVVADRLRDMVAEGGTLAVGHLHNADVNGGPMGPARTADEWAALFPDARIYDEQALLSAMMDGVVPDAIDWCDDTGIEAWSVVEGGVNPRALTGGVCVPPATAQLRANPLIGADGPAWPSPRYEREYAPRATWTDRRFVTTPDRDRRLLDLPERW